MNGLALVLVLAMAFIAGMEGAAPGVTAEAVRVAALIYSDPALPAQLAAAIAAKGAL